MRSSDDLELITHLVKDVLTAIYEEKIYTLAALERHTSLSRGKLRAFLGRGNGSILSDIRVTELSNILAAFERYMASKDSERASVELAEKQKELKSLISNAGNFDDSGIEKLRPYMKIFNFQSDYMPILGKYLCFRRSPFRKEIVTTCMEVSRREPPFVTWTNLHKIGAGHEPYRGMVTEHYGHFIFIGIRPTGRSVNTIKVRNPRISGLPSVLHGVVITESSNTPTACRVCFLRKDVEDLKDLLDFTGSIPEEDAISLGLELSHVDNSFVDNKNSFSVYPYPDE